MIIYTYEGKEYETLYDVRLVCPTVFPSEPSDELLASIGITVEDRPDPEPDIEEVRSAKLEAIKQGLEEYRKSATMMSSLGFVVDATERSLVDVQGLIVLNPPGSHVIFRDANNEFHQITVEDLHTLQKEIYAKGLEGYNTKWKLDKAVAEAKTIEEINSVEVKYV